MKTTKPTNNMMNEDLSALVAKAKTGDQAAFTELYDRTAPELYRCIRAMTRDEDLTWDIQQDAYLKAYESLNTLESNDAFFPWLRRIAVNGTVSHMRKQRTLSFTELVSDEDADTTPELPDLSVENQPELSLDRKETARLVQEILSKLPEEQQLIVGMHYYDELSVKEIAETLKLSTGAVKAQLFHGRKKVETAVRALEKQGVKLYGLSPVAFLVALMRRAEPAASASVKQAAVKAAVAKGTVDAVASAAVPVAAKTFGQVLAGRLLAGALAVALIGGGIWGGAKLLKSSNTDAPYQPTTSVTDERLAGVETPEELTATNEDLPVVTEPVVTNPISNEPEESTAPTEAPTEPTKPTEAPEPQPVGTDPAVTEPSAAEPADPVRADNQCGEHLTWSFDPETGWLTIAGSGPMDDYADVTDTPWYSIRSEITRVNVPDGLTAIGDNAFAGCTALEYAWLSSEQLCRIGAHAFDGCANGSFTLYSYSSTNDRAPLELGDYAFRGCSLHTMICPYYVTRIGTGAFADCNMTKLWIINADCAIGAAVADPSVTLQGLPNSAAARYAAQNAYSFHPMTEISRDSVVGLLGQEGNHLRYAGLIPCDSRFILNVVRADRVTATEAEIQQAAQTGTIVLAGKEYPYADSVEEAAEWSEMFTNPYNDNGWLGVNNDEVVGWIQRYEGDYYKVMRQDDRYVFCHCSWVGEWDPYLNEYVDLGWLWLDADNPYDINGGKYSSLGEATGFYYVFDTQVCGLKLNDEGQIVLSWNSAGKK